MVDDYTWSASRCPLWVNNCRAGLQRSRPLYPRKLPRQLLSGAAAKGQKQTHALQHDWHAANLPG